MTEELRPIPHEERVKLAERLARIESSIEALRGDLARFFSEHDDHETRLRELERNDTRQNERLGIVAGGLAILQVITSAVAAWIGATR